MNRLDLVEQFMERMGTGWRFTNDIFDTFLELIRTGVIQNGHVKLQGFGSWHVKKNNKKRYYDIELGEVKPCSHSSRLTFRPADRFRNRVRRIA